MRKRNILTLFSILGLAINTANATCDDVSRDDLIAAAADVVEGNTYLLDAQGNLTGYGGGGALDPAATSINTPNGGFDLPMWLVMVDETGTVCHVINSGPGVGTGDNEGPSVGNRGWLGSRNIAAQKAGTANFFSTDYYAISTANLFGTIQDNQSLSGLQHSNPIDTDHAYGNPIRYGTKNDPMVGRRIGGVNVFGGGLALYDGNGKIGAIGLSGDTSCTDHVIAWKIREALSLNQVPRGISNENFSSDGTPLVLGGGLGDEMYMDEANIGTATANGWEHASCPNTPDAAKNANAIVGTLP